MDLPPLSAQQLACAKTKDPVVFEQAHAVFRDFCSLVTSDTLFAFLDRKDIHYTPYDEREKHVAYYLMMTRLSLWFSRYCVFHPVSVHNFIVPAISLVSLLMKVQESFPITSKYCQSLRFAHMLMLQSRNRFVLQHADLAAAYLGPPQTRCSPIFARIEMAVLAAVNWDLVATVGDNSFLEAVRRRAAAEKVPYTTLATAIVRRLTHPAGQTQTLRSLVATV